METPFYSRRELSQIGLSAYGDNVLISKKACLYTPSLISIGSNVRIDDFCILSGGITLGSYIHIGAYSALYGKFGIVMSDYTGLSPRCTIFSATDDFGGNYLISPMVPKGCTHVYGTTIIIEKYSQVGAGTVILPNAILHEGVAVGAMSLVKKELDAWSIYAGNPLRLLKERDRGLLDFIKKISEENA